MQTKISPEMNKCLNYATERRKLFTGIAQLLWGWLGALFLGIAIIGFVAGSGRSLSHLPSLLFTIMLFCLCILLILRGGKNLRDYRIGRDWAGEGGQVPPTAKSPSATTAAVTTPQTATVTGAEAWSVEVTPPIDSGTRVKIKCESCGAVAIPDSDGRCEYCGTKVG